MVSVWRALLIVYRELDVRLRQGSWRRRRFRHVATDEQVRDATESFRAFPGLVARLTSGATRIDHNIVEIDAPLKSLTGEGGDCFWPSPDDTRRQLDELAPAGAYESIFVFWPQSDPRTRTSIRCRGWGLGMAASDWSNGATYATVANAPSWVWQREAPGEVWLHEWLHGVCHHFANQGHTMPIPDADGAEVHGYTRSQDAGWTDYYHDLMTGNVLENGKLVGIPRDAWRTENRRVV